MKRKACFGLFFVLVAAMVTAQPLQAISLGSGLHLDASGAVSVTAGTTLTLTVKVTNNSQADIRCVSLQAVVIDPWSGTRILGPNTISVPTNQQLIHGEVWSQPDPYLPPILVQPGGSTTMTVPLAIPATIPKTYTSTVNKTLAVIIYTLDNASTVRGTAGWGFVTMPSAP